VMSRDYPENRIRLKCIGGGGGKVSEFYLIQILWRVM